MKTTLDINDSLFEQAKRISQREGVTLRSLVEQGLRQVLRQRASSRKASVDLPVFEGQIGLGEAFHGGDWSVIKEEARRR